MIGRGRCSTKFDRVFPEKEKIPRTMPILVAASLKPFNFFIYVTAVAFCFLEIIVAAAATSKLRSGRCARGGAGSTN
jgi:hypothetical protein